MTEPKKPADAATSKPAAKSGASAASKATPAASAKSTAAKPGAKPGAKTPGAPGAKKPAGEGKGEGKGKGKGKGDGAESGLARRLLNPGSMPSQVAQGSAKATPGGSKVCYVHFGMHKTGTTSVQDTLAKIGARDNWRYVHAGQRNGSLAVQAAFKDNPHNTWLIKQEGFERDQADKLREAARSALAEVLRQPADIYILSAEALTSLSEGEVQTLVSWLRDFVDEVVGIGYVRSAQSYMESAFQQHLKTRANRKFQFDRTYPRYRQRLEKWDNVLGRDQVLLTPFDKEALHGGDVVLDFASKVGIRIEPGEIVRSNESVSLDAMKLLYVHEAGMAPDLEPKKRLAQQLRFGKLLGDMPGERLRFGAKLLAPVLADNASDIVWAEERVGAPLGALREDEDKHTVRGKQDMRKLTERGMTWVNEQLERLDLPTLAKDANPEAVQAAVKRIAAGIKQLMADD